MATCAQCLFENPEGSQLCEQCGAELMEVLSLQLGEVCRKCDSYNDPGVRVCISCGNRLGSQGAAEAAEQAPSPSSQTQLGAEERSEAEQEAPLPVAPAEPAASKSHAALQDRMESTTPAGSSAPQAASPVVDFSDKTREPPGAAQAPLEDSSSLTSAAPSSLPQAQAPIAPPPEPPPGWAAVQRQRPRVAGGQVCEACQSDNPLTARFCGTCGAALKSAERQTAFRARLIVVRGDDEGRQIPVNDTPITVGRKVGTLTFPSDPYLAPHHATFFFRGEKLFIRDEGSTNGSYIRMRREQLLNPGDMFVLGERVLRFAGLKTSAPQDPQRFGSPLGAGPLMVVEEVLEGGQLGRVCKRPGPSMSIGRGSCDLNFPHDGFVSLRHAELVQSPQGVILRDLESANGTYLRLSPNSEQTLAHGDYVVFGRELLRVEMSS